MQDENNGYPAPEESPQSATNGSHSETAADPYRETVSTATEPAPPVVKPGGSGNGGSVTPPAPPDGGDDEEEGMLRMSFLEHLEELRSRIIRALAGIGVAFVVSLVFANELWVIVSQPATKALTDLGFPPNLIITKPMETFSIVWVKLPLLASIFLASPWILYQVWAFIAPGLYRRERRWASPFVLASAGLFITGGLFAYFVVFRFGLTFLLGIGKGINIQPYVTITDYFDLFVNITLGVGLVFELPVLIFFLTLLRIVSPGFLLRHSRYAILAIVIIAAVVTPTPDVFNMMLFAVPMLVLFFIGVLASYLLVLHREERAFPWKKTLYIVGVILLPLAGVLWIWAAKYGYHFMLHWPFLTK